MTMNEDTRRQPIQADRGRGRAVRCQHGGRSSLNDAVEAVLRCQGCDHSEECALWLKRADVATAPPNVIKAMANHVMTDKGLDQFVKDAQDAGIKIV